MILDFNCDGRRFILILKGECPETSEKVRENRGGIVGSSQCLENLGQPAWKIKLGINDIHDHCHNDNDLMIWSPNRGMN